MGCFSFLCSTCGDPINSNSFSGEHCVLILLDDGKMIEWMQGEYDSYGRVFKSSSGKDQKPAPGGDGFVCPEAARVVGDDESQLWETMDWGEVCTLMSNDNPETGIAAYHTECWGGGDPEVSIDDPEQGWGKYEHPTEGEFRHVKVASRVTWVSAGDFPEEDE